MFPSVHRRPICTFSARAVRLQCSNGSREAHSAAPGRSGPVSWLGGRVGLLLTWLQKAGEGASEVGKKKKEGLLSILANQCSFVTGQRLRRAFQITELYSNIYSERTKWTLVGSLWRRLQAKHSNTGKLIAALAGVFMWEDEKIREDEMRRLVLFVSATTFPIHLPVLGVLQN